MSSERSSGDKEPPVMELTQITGKRPRSQRFAKKPKASEPKASEQKTRANKQPAVHKRLKKSTSQADSALIEASPVPEARQASPTPEPSEHLYLMPGDNLD